MLRAITKLMPIYGGMECGGTKFVCATGAESGKLLARTEFPATTPAETIARALEFFQAQPHPLQSIGIGSFGPVDLNPASPKFGYITSTPKSGWRDTDLMGAAPHQVQGVRVQLREFSEGDGTDASRVGESPVSLHLWLPRGGVAGGPARRRGNDRYARARPAASTTQMKVIGHSPPPCSRRSYSAKISAHCRASSRTCLSAFSGSCWSASWRVLSSIRMLPSAKQIRSSFALSTSVSKRSISAGSASSGTDPTAVATMSA